MLVFNPFTGTFDNVSNPASTTALGTIALAGDLGGTAASPSVLKINGVTISGTPSSGQVIVASSPTAAAWGSGSSSTQRSFAFFAG